jgi:predicted RNase H-like HicB family nuclease
MTTRDQVLDFEIAFEPDEGGFHVWCPLLKGCHSFGVSKEEARENIREAIEGWLESAEELGFPIPEREHITVAPH